LEGESHLAQARISYTEHDAIPDKFIGELSWNDTASLRFSQNRRFFNIRSKKRPSFLKTQAFCYDKPRKNVKLFTQVQFGDQRRITLVVFGIQIVQQLATAADHAQQATAAMVVFGVGFEMGGQLVDTGGEQCDLDFRATGVTGLACVVFDDSGFDAGCDHLDFL
jgi:hypothetical protein